MRLFIGIELPGGIKQSLVQFQEELKSLGANGKWKKPGNIHLTLEFLGETEPVMLPQIEHALQAGVINIESFKLGLSGIGAFPSFKRPHTLWIGTSGETRKLHDLRERIHHELLKTAVAVDAKDYSPHITIASRPLLKGVDLSLFQQKDFGEFTVKEVILFDSRVDKGNRFHHDLLRLKLGMK